MAMFETTGEREQAWKVGALAKATGLTVRALHHYDSIGLLPPSLRTAAGHRLYTAADVARLYRISLLRRLGFPLQQITSVLGDPEWRLAAAVRRHLQHTQERAAIAARLCTHLAGMAEELDRHDHPSAEQLFSTLEEMAMLDGTIHSTTGLLVYDDLAAAQAYLLRVYGLTPRAPRTRRRRAGCACRVPSRRPGHLPPPRPDRVPPPPLPPPAFPPPR